ncbi:MAG: hypothetical protein JXB38_11230 [Anaerolineales bacterium]|nr:hypothetical protein [Anaerolineales bacterium]
MDRYTLGTITLPVLIMVIIFTRMFNFAAFTNNMQNESAKKKITLAIFLIRWVLATLLGVTVGSLLAYRSASILYIILGTDKLSSFVDFYPIILEPVCIGLSTGIFQWLVLRSIIKKSGWWVLATTVGWLTWELFVYPFSTFNFMALLGSDLGQLLVVGGVLGSLQWLVLRKKSPYAGLWIVMTLLGVSADAAMAVFMDTYSLFDYSVFGLLIGLFTGLLTGLHLIVNYDDYYEKQQPSEV